MTALKDPETIIRKRFSDAGITIKSIDRRDYPEETIFIVLVNQAQLSVASEKQKSLKVSNFESKQPRLHP